VEIRFKHAVCGEEYELSSGDLREAIDGAALASPEGLAFAREVIRRGEEGLRQAKGKVGGQP
jgi:hypothetical protein